MGVQPAIAGMRRSRWFLKTTAVVVAVSFLGLTLQPLAIAAQLPPAKKSSAPAPRPSSDDERLSANLEKIEAHLSKMEEKLSKREDASRDISELKALHKELEALDKAALDNFDKIKKQLEEKKLPKVILDRHEEAVRTYRYEMETLKANLEDLNKARDDDEREVKARKAKEHLKEKQKKKPHTPLDPNNLPFRIPDAKKTRKPAKKKEDFQKLGLLQEERIQLASTALLPGMLATGILAAFPSPADLTPTEDVQITPEIQALAASLGNNPVKIYNWVHNNIYFVPTYGSIQGSQMCLETRQCNAFDTASLLIALLRASNIPARYAYGTVEVPIAKVMNWVGGVTVAEAALQLLGQGGIPNVGITQGGEFVAVQMEHVWVEAYVDFHPSRAAINRQSSAWIPVDASFKQYQYTTGVDLQTVALDQATRDHLRNALTFNPQDGSLISINASLLQTSFNNIITNLQNHFSQAIPNVRPKDVLGSKALIQRTASVLATSLPYRVIVDSTFSSLADSLRHYISIKIYPDALSKALNRADFEYRIGLPTLGYKPFSLSYDVATPDDIAVIKSNFDPQTGVPAYLINVKPVLRVAGNVVASGAPTGLALEQVLDATVHSPNVPPTTQTKIIASGSYNTVVPQYTAVSPKHFQVISSRVSATKAKLESGDIADLKKDDLIGEFLYGAGLGYWAQSEQFNRIIASQAKITRNVFQRVGIFSFELQTQYVFGVPVKTKMGPLVSDIRISVETAVALDNDYSKVLSYQRSSLTLMSRLEGTIWKQSTGDNTASEGITAASLLSQAGNSGVPIYEIRSNTVSTVLPQLTVNAAVKNDITNSIAAGKTVQIARDSLVKEGWTGTGYIVRDPVTGSGAYLISGGANGGTVLGDLARKVNDEVLLLASLASYVTDLAADLNKVAALLSPFISVLSLFLSILDLFSTLAEYAALDCLTDEGWTQFLQGMLIMFVLGIVISSALPIYGDVFASLAEIAFLYEWGGILRIMVAEAYIRGQSCRVPIPNPFQ